MRHPFGDLRVMYPLLLWLIGKPDFLFVIIKLFHSYYGWDNIGENQSSRCFSKGVDQFKHKFQVEEDIAHLPLWYQNVSMCSFVLSQSTHVTDRQTDGQYYDSQDHASIAVLCGINWEKKKQATYLVHFQNCSRDFLLQVFNSVTLLCHLCLHSTDTTMNYVNDQSDSVTLKSWIILLTVQTRRALNKKYKPE